MNERIIELANKANEDVGYAFKLEDAKQIHKLMEKFAQLIVRECLDIVANADMTELEGPDPEDVLYVACKQIREHFGVEQ